MKHWIAILIFLVFATLSLLAQNITAPTINCVTTNEESGDVSISWSPAAINPCGPFVRFIIFGSTTPGGPYQVVGSTSNPSATSFAHTGANGTILDWYYRIVQEQNCPGTGIDTSAEYSDEVFYSPSIEYVSVNSSNQVEIHWTPSSSSQTIAYIISYCTGLAGNPPLPQYAAIDTVFGQSEDSYIDLNANASGQSYSYSIQGLNGCGEITAYDPCQQTIYLSQPASADPCSGALILEWNPYINWSDILEYRVVYTVDGGSPESITVDPETIFPSGTAEDARAQFEFPLNNIVGSQICFNINAIHENATPISVSNQLCLYLDQVSSTAYNYLTELTVNDNQEIELAWLIDTSADINKYIIKRATDMNLAAIDSLIATNPLTFYNPYTDNTADVASKSYYYTVASIDECNLQKESTIGRSILLEEENNQSSVVNVLKWNAFEIENANIINYKLFRKGSNNTEIPLRDFSPAETLIYEDEIGTEASDNGQYCYVVEAQYQLNLVGLNIFDTKTSRSNVLCLEQEPVIYIPNAFVPSGENNYFKPVLLFRQLNSYEFMIFDRYGKRIFQTEKQTAGWDGSYNGETLPMGGYVYYLKIETLGGRVEERRGVVALIR